MQIPGHNIDGDLLPSGFQAERIIPEQEDFLPVVSTQKGIIGIQNDKVVLYSQNGIEGYTHTPEISKFLLFSHQLRGRPENISLNDISAFKVEAETFLYIAGDVYYFDENEIQLILISQSKVPLEKEDIRFESKGKGVVVQTPSWVIYKPFGEDFEILPVGYGEILTDIDEEGFLHIQNLSTGKLKQVHLRIYNKSFFKAHLCQSILDLYSTIEEKNAYFDVIKGEILDDLMIYTSLYGDSEEPVIRLENGKIEVAFLGETPLKWFAADSLETKIEELIISLRVKAIYSEAFPEAKISLHICGSKIIVSCLYSNGTTIYYDVGTKDFLHYPDDSRIMTSGDAEAYKSLFSQNDQEIEKKGSQTFLLYTFGAFYFQVENDGIGIYENKNNYSSKIGVLDLSLDIQLSTKEQLVSFLGRKIEHNFTQIQGHLFLTLEYENDTKVVYRFSPQSGDFVEELRVKKTKKSISFRTRPDFIKVPGFLLVHKVKIGEGVGIYVGEKEKRFFPKTQMHSTLDVIQPPKDLDKEREAEGIKKKTIDMFEGVETYEMGGKMYANIDNLKALEVKQVDTLERFYKIGEYIFEVVWLDNGKKGLKKHFSIPHGASFYLCEDDFGISLLVFQGKNIEEFEFHGTQHIFQKVDEQINLILDMQDSKVIQVGKQIFLLESSGNMMAQVREIFIPKEIGEYTFVHDTGVLGIDVLDELQGGVSRYFFDKEVYAFNFNSPTVFPHFQYGKPAGDVYVGNMGDVKLYRNGLKISLHHHGIRTSEYDFPGKVEIITLGDSFVLIGENEYYGSGNNSAYRFDVHSGNLAIMGRNSGSLIFQNFSYSGDIFYIENSLGTGQYGMYKVNQESGDMYCFGIIDVSSGKEIHLNDILVQGKIFLQQYASGDFVFIENVSESGVFSCFQFREGKIKMQIGGDFLRDSQGFFYKR